MADKLDMKSMDITQENIAKIRALFPAAVTEVMGEDGKPRLAIDFDVLKQELSADLIEEKQERYQMTWPDKSKAKVLANSRITATLRPDREKSVNFDTTENLYIEGDNLDVLKLLRETYLGKVKMIYIDPPYNTGNDFVYEDDFAMSAEDYAEVSGQYDEQGNRLVVNTESNGRFHTDWLNMIYPRLKIARDLLTDDGVIFISIDDNEVENLKKITSEIFGENNFVAQLVWEKKKKGAFLSKNYINMKEYILVYAKSNNTFGGLIGEVTSAEETYPCIKTTNARGIRVIPAQTISKYKEKNYSIPAGTRISSGNMELVYLDELIVKDGFSVDDVRIDSNWIYGQEAINTFAKQKLLYITQDNYIRRIVNEERTKMLKDLLTRVGTDGKSLPTYSYDENLNNGGWGTNEDANDELHKILNQQYLFDFSKPSRLIAKLIQAIDDTDMLVLDFFSGSATTAHAVMQLNAEDGGKRKFIMVQLPEKCDEKSEAYKAGYKTICDIGEERIRRVGKELKKALLISASIDLAPMTFFNDTSHEEEQNAKFDQKMERLEHLDVGFRVLRLDSSNMQEVYYNPAAMTQSLLETTVDNVKPDRTPLDLLFQVMLDLGIELSAKIEEHSVNGKTYYTVNGNDIIACFDDDIDNDVITAIAKQLPLYAVFKDKSFATA